MGVSTASKSNMKDNIMDKGWKKVSKVNENDLLIYIKVGVQNHS